MGAGEGVRRERRPSGQTNSVIGVMQTRTIRIMPLGQRQRWSPLFSIHASALWATSRSHSPVSAKDIVLFLRRGSCASVLKLTMCRREAGAAPHRAKPSNDERAQAYWEMREAARRNRMAAEGAARAAQPRHHEPEQEDLQLQTYMEEEAPSRGGSNPGPQKGGMQSEANMAELRRQAYLDMRAAAERNKRLVCDEGVSERAREIDDRRTTCSQVLVRRTAKSQLDGLWHHGDLAVQTRAFVRRSL